MVNECKGSLKKKYENFHRGEGVNSIRFFIFVYILNHPAMQRKVEKVRYPPPPSGGLGLFLGNNFGSGCISIPRGYLF